MLVMRLIIPTALAIADKKNTHNAMFYFITPPMARIQKHGIKIIFLQALVAMLGSLYYGFFGDPVVNMTTGEFFSRANGLTPCVWCWYARICMYPIVLVSAVWLWKKTRDAIDYILPLALVWTAVEIYQVAQIYIPQIRGMCSRDVPCFIPSVNYFGRLTIPLMCLIAFIVILIVGCAIKAANKKAL